MKTSTQSKMKQARIFRNMSGVASHKHSYAFIFVVLLAGCTPAPHQNISLATPPAPQTTHEYRGGTTYMTYSAHGTQIEYFGKDGATALWYPGNTVIVRGRWKLAGGNPGNGEQDQICFQYGADSYNPITMQSGGRWECSNAARHSANIVETTKGDPFGLSKRSTVPYILPRDRTTFHDLLQKRSS